MNIDGALNTDGTWPPLQIDVDTGTDDTLLTAPKVNEVPEPDKVAVLNGFELLGDWNAVEAVGRWDVKVVGPEAATTVILEPGEGVFPSMISAHE